MVLDMSLLVAPSPPAELSFESEVALQAQETPLGEVALADRTILLNGAGGVS